MTASFPFPFGCPICAVEVDAETGEVKIDKYVAVNDCGNVFNPMLVDGRGKSVRVAWSNNAADKRIVDDLIAYLLSL